VTSHLQEPLLKCKDDGEAMTVLASYLDHVGNRDAKVPTFTHHSQVHARGLRLHAISTALRCSWDDTKRLRYMCDDTKTRRIGKVVSRTRPSPPSVQFFVSLSFSSTLEQ